MKGKVFLHLGAVFWPDGKQRQNKRPTPRFAGRGARSKRATRDDFSLYALTSDMTFFRSDDGDDFAFVPREDRVECWAVESPGFDRLLTERGRLADPTYRPSRGDIDSARLSIGGRPGADDLKLNPRHRVYERDGHFYIDLTDAGWRAVEIRRDGWSILDDHKVPFVRNNSARPIPEPQDGETIEILRRFVNTSDDDFVMVLAWLIAALSPRGPYPMLVLSGEHGSGKSLLAKILRDLVDPTGSKVRPMPRVKEDIFLAAHNSHVVAYDNLSFISGAVSDVLCGLATGTTETSRKLYSNNEENERAVCAPVMINGITALTGRADLASRGIIVNLVPIDDAYRRDEARLLVEFEAARPYIFGVLCNALSRALRDLGTFELASVPRMADFAYLVAAAAPALGFSRETFLDVYARNRGELQDAVVGNDVVASALVSFADGHPNGWRGSMTALLELLGSHAGETVRRAREWPATPRALSNDLDRSAPLLRDKGITIDRGRSNGASFVRISRKVVEV
jgi:putative DNA primase/helicase